MTEAVQSEAEQRPRSWCSLSSSSCYLAGRRLYIFDVLVPGPAIEPLVAGTIDARRIAARGDEVLRLAASIRMGGGTRQRA